MPEEYRIEIVPRAVSDLRAIFDFIERDSPRHALKMVGKLHSSIETLRGLPYRHALIRGSRKARANVRSMIVYPYVVDYRVNESREMVSVLRVRHGARQNHG